MTGTLIGVGVGPGDPDLITLRAARLIADASVIAYPAPDQGESLARSIAAGIIPGGICEIPIRIPMCEDRFPAQDIYEQAARQITEQLEAGTDVVVLCQGDPFFYGSFMYLFRQIAGCYPTEIVPGVSSIGACAAAAAEPICARLEPLTVVPAPLPDDRIRAALEGPGACIIMKVGRHLSRMRDLLERLRLADRAILVSRASLPEQKVTLMSDAPDSTPYFSTILVPGRDPYAND